jgi:acetylornithine deacetylase/succinyl-diaminopimelate desuccinylase-like protein
LVTTAEKGVGWRRLTVKGTPGHGSRPLGADSALIKAAEVVRRLADFEPAAKLDDLWEAKIIALGLDADLTARLLDPGAVQEAIRDVPRSHRANLHSCAHMSFSPNVIHGGVKTNVIPDDVEVSIINDDPSSASPARGPLWESLTDAMQMAFPGVSIIPSMVTGGTDSRFFRQRGVTAYGAGLLSPSIDAGEFFDRFHGHNERIDVASLRMTTQLWLDVADRLWTHT